MPRRSRKQATTFESAGRLAEAISQYPREFVGLVMATIAVVAILTNALFLQKGPHPAPIFAPRPLLAAGGDTCAARAEHAAAPAADTGNQARLQLIANIQRELTRKGFYDGPADGIWGSKTDTAVRDFIQAAGLKSNAEASDGLLRAVSASNAKPAATTGQSTAPDAIGKLITPSKRVTCRAAGARRFRLRTDQGRPVFSTRIRRSRSRSSNATASCRSTGRSPTASCANLPR